MTEKELSGQMRFSSGTHQWRIVLKSLRLMVILSCLALLDDTLAQAGPGLILGSFLLLVLINLNLLGYIELAVSSPRKGGSYRLVQTSEENNLLAFLAGQLVILAGLCVGSVLIRSFAIQASALASNLFGLTLPELPVSAAFLAVVAGLKLLPAGKKQLDHLLILLLGVLVITGLAAAPRMDLDHLRFLELDWKATFSLLLISYLSVEFASEMLGDLRDSSKHGPRVLFLSALLGGLLPILVSGIALASGMAGAYALSREDVSAALPGVAITAALAPPLGVVGIGLATGNLHAAGGAYLLFITNIITISLAEVIAFTLLGIHSLNLQPEIKKRVRRGITGVAFLALVITTPLAVLMRGIIRQSRENQAIERLLLESPFLEDTEIMDIARTQSGDQLLISATVKASGSLTQEQVAELALTLEEELGRQLTLDIITLPGVRSGP